MTNTQPIRRLVTVIGVSLLTGCTVPAPPTQRTEAVVAADRLLTLMQTRLELMHDVARWKWNAKQVVADPRREQQLLDRLVQQGWEHGLGSERTRAVFAAQIKAARMIQEADFHRWIEDQHGSFAHVPDLASAQRPRIDAVSSDLLKALAESQPFLDDGSLQPLLQDRAVAILTGDGIDDEVRRVALAPFVSSP